MDSSVAHTQICLEAIRNRVRKGTIDAQSMHNMLICELEQELNKSEEEVDMEYVAACDKLLTLLNQSREQSMDSHFEKNLTAIRNQMEKHTQLPRGLLRPVAAICMTVLVLFLGVYAPDGKIVTSQAPDNEQYIVHGVETTPKLSANADMVLPTGTWTTTNWVEAVACYGREPCIPTWIPAGWKVHSYSIDLLSNYARFSVTYTDDQEGWLVFSEMRLYSVDNLYSEIEQNEEGRFVVVEGGTKVYITKNMELLTAEWNEPGAEYTLMGDISEELLLQCIASVAQREE